MAERSKQLTTHSGFAFHIRPARKDDEDALHEFFKNVTAEDLRFRFLGSVKEVDHQRLLAMINVDHHQTESFVAKVHEDGPIIAAGMLACDAGLKVGEVAISIRSDHKSRGISWEMLRHITQVAEAKGLQSLQSLEDRSNQSAIRLEKEMGFSSRPYPGDSTLVLLEKTLNPQA
jgi:N-acetylglutamate synthase-like GNAT family acetyltransferase